MALDWLKMEHDLPDKPEVIAIAAACGISVPHSIGCLFMAWRWVDRQSDDGTAPGSIAVIDHITQFEGFGQAMIDVGWLVVEGRVLTFPFYTEKHGKTARRRATENRRKQRLRAKNAVQNGTSGRKGADIRAQRAGRAAPQEQEQEQEQESKDPPTPQGGTGQPIRGDQGFMEFWDIYPKRNGKKGNKGQALVEWMRLDMNTRRRVYKAARNLAAAVEADGEKPPDAQRFLIPPNRKAGADPRWVEWEHAEPTRKKHPNDKVNQTNGTMDRFLKAVENKENQQ